MGFDRTANTWFRLQPKSDRSRSQAVYRSLDQLPENGDLSGEINLSGFPAEVFQALERARGRQARKKKTFDTKLESLRQSYLMKLLKLRQTFEDGGLKIQLESVDRE